MIFKYHIVKHFKLLTSKKILRHKQISKNIIIHYDYGKIINFRVKSPRSKRGRSLRERRVRLLRRGRS